jgi:Fe-S-cluster containining protein
MPLPPIPRQQRRRLRRELLERGHKAINRGVGPGFVDDDALGVALILRDTLADASNPRRASDMAATAEAMLERSIKADLKEVKIGCHKGCGYCCRALVTVSAPEIFRVAHWVAENAGRALPIPAEALVAEGDRRAPMTEMEMFHEMAPCALLVEEACGVYEVRPLPCRALYSTSSEACRLAMQEAKGQVPIVGPPMNKAEIVRAIMMAAMQSLGFSDRGYELSQAVGHVLRHPDAEQRWLAGEDVLGPVRGSDRMKSAGAVQEQLVVKIRMLAD